MSTINHLVHDTHGQAAIGLPSSKPLSIISQEQFKNFIEAYVNASFSEKERMLHDQIFDQKAFIQIKPLDSQNHRFVAKLEEIRQKGLTVLKDCPQDFIGDEQFMLQAAELDLKAIPFTSKSLQSEEHYLLQLLDQNLNSLAEINPWLNKQPRLTLKIIHTFFQRIQKTCEKEDILNRDAKRKVVEWFELCHKLENEILDSDYSHKVESDLSPDLELIIDRLQNTRELIFKIITLKPEACNYINEELAEDPEFMFEAIVKNPRLIPYLGISIKEDSDFIFKMMDHYENNLKATYDHLDQDVEPFLKAYKLFLSTHEKIHKIIQYQNVSRKSKKRLNNLLQNVSQTLKTNKSLWLEVVAITPDIADHLPISLYEDLDFIIQICKYNKLFSHSNFSKVRMNQKFWLKYFNIKNTDDFYHIPEEFKNNSEFIKKLVCACPDLLNQRFKELKKDENFIFDCFLNDPEMLSHYEGELTLDYVYKLSAVNPLAINYLSRHMIDLHWKVIYAYISQNLKLLPDLSKTIKSHEALIIEIVNDHPETLDQFDGEKIVKLIAKKRISLKV